MPRVAVQPNPRALPMASTSSPTLTSSESPKVAGWSPRTPSILSSARSVGSSFPMSVAE
jgi:hypothetical protein